MKVKAADIYNRAADILDERGWGQGSYYADYDTYSGCCLLGAVMVAGGECAQRSRPLYRQDLDAYGSMDVHNLWRPLTAHVDVQPATWNDQKGRTKEEVQAALRSVAVFVGDLEVEL